MVGVHGSRQLVLDEDEHACYAYLLDADEVVGDAWLYNVSDAPESDPWREPGARPPFANPVRLVRADLHLPLPDELDTATAQWLGDGTVVLTCRGVVWARLWPGAKPGESRMAAGDGPLARRLDEPLPDEEDDGPQPG